MSERTFRLGAIAVCVYWLNMMFDRLNTNRLFVYGTLQPGKPNSHILQPFGGHWIPGYVRGTLHSEGWGANLGYPALSLDPNGQPIEGQILEADTLSSAWAELDAFEGPEYERLLATAFTRDHEPIEAFVYALRRDA